MAGVGIGTNCAVLNDTTMSPPWTEGIEERRRSTGNEADGAGSGMVPGVDADADHYDCLAPAYSSGPVILQNVQTALGNSVQSPASAPPTSSKRRRKKAQQQQSRQCHADTSDSAADSPATFQPHAVSNGHASTTKHAASPQSVHASMRTSGSSRPSLQIATLTHTLGYHDHSHNQSNGYIRDPAGTSPSAKCGSPRTACASSSGTSAFGSTPVEPSTRGLLARTVSERSSSGALARHMSNRLGSGGTTGFSGQQQLETQPSLSHAQLQAQQPAASGVQSGGQVAEGERNLHKASSEIERVKGRLTADALGHNAGDSLGGMGSILSAAPLRVDEDQMQSFYDYLQAESHPAAKLPAADVVWGQTERERVYNFLIYVPYQLERLIVFGTLLCIDAFLGVFTVLPYRCAVALAQVVSGLLTRARIALTAQKKHFTFPTRAKAVSADVMEPTAIGPNSLRTASLSRAANTRSASPSNSNSKARHRASHIQSTLASSQQQQQSSAKHASTSVQQAAAHHSSTQPHSAPSVTAPATTGATPAGTNSAGTAAAGVAAHPTSAKALPVLLQGGQVFDLMCLLILIASAVILRMIKPGFIYYWMKDITSEFLKMSVISSALEIADKILGNFGIDVLEALSGTCTQWVLGKRTILHVGSDAAVALAIVSLHGLTLMCQALVVAVALSSHHNGLLALLIANNFVEIKGTVFKKWDVPRIWSLVCMDVVERFHLLVVMLFVVVEDMDSSASWSPSKFLLWESCRIMGAEVVIDIVKHAVLGKFNDIRPGIYREFMKDMCEAATSVQSHSCPRVLRFHHLGPAALCLRIGITLFWLKADTPKAISTHAVLLVLAFIVAMIVKPLLGYSLKVIAHLYVLYYQGRYTTLKHRGHAHADRPPVRMSGSIGGAMGSVAAASARLLRGGRAAHAGSAGGAAPSVTLQAGVGCHSKAE